MLGEPPGVCDLYPGALAFPCWAEPKADGFRLQASRISGVWKFWSRGGQELHLPEIAAELAALDPEITELDGELMGLSFSAASAGLATAQARYLVFDLPGPGSHARRRRRLEAAIPAVPSGSRAAGPGVQVLSRLGRVCRSDAEAEAAFRDFRAAGWEGAVYKAPGAAYGREWFRRKDMVTIDAPIVGTELGGGRLSATVGAVLVAVDGVVTRIGAGLSDAVRAELLAAGAGALGQVVEFRAQERLASGKYRFPVFVRLRPDKRMSA